MPAECGASPALGDPPLFDRDVPPLLDALPAALAALRATLADAAYPPETADATELILAEALTNIVRHARPPGPIRLTARADGGGLAFFLEDDGAPLPGGRLPAGRLPPVDVASPDLPEGGFGVFLIRSLARDLAYDTCQGRNRLSFHVAVAPARPAVKLP